MKKKTINIILGSLLTGSMVAGVVDAIAETKTDPEPQKEQDQQKRLSMILSKIRESVLGVVGRSIVDNEYNKPTPAETTQQDERSDEDRTLFEKIAQKHQQIDALGIGSLSVKFKHDDMHNLDNVGKQLAPKLIDIIEPSELDSPVRSGTPRSVEPADRVPDVVDDTPDDLNPIVSSGDLPSDLPGDVPTELPGDLPSDVPTDTPGDISDGIGHDDELDPIVSSNPGNLGSNGEANNPIEENKTLHNAPTNPFNQSDLPIVDMKVGDILFGKEVKHVPSNKLSYRQILNLSEDDRYKKSLEDIDESYVAGNSQMWLGAGDSVVKAFNNNEFLDTHLLNRYFVNYVNAERKLHGIEPLEYEPGFQKQADIRALEMAEYGHIRYNGHAHTRPNGDKWITVMDGVVPHYPYGLGENILAYSVLSNPYQLTSEQFVAKTLFERWKNSKSHYENMMDSRLTRTAVSVKLTTRTGAKSENETNWIIGEQILADGKVGDIL